MRRTLAPAVSLAVLLAGVLALSSAPAALADTSFTADLPAGGSLSTGSAVSAADPLQLTVTAPQGGSFTIDEVTSPSQRPALAGGEQMMWFGPQFAVSTPEIQTVTVTMVADPSALPPAPTRGANPQWRRDPQKLCSAKQGPTPGFCITNQAAMTLFCDVLTSSMSAPDCTGADKGLGAPQLLSDGDIQVSMQVAVGTSTTFAAGYRPWACGPNAADTIVVNSANFDSGNLGDLIAHGIYYDDGCSQGSSVSGQITVPAAVARALHLHTTVIGSISSGPGAGPIELSSAAKAALRRHPRAIEVRVALTGHGPQAGQSWSDTETLHVRR